MLARAATIVRTAAGIVHPASSPHSLMLIDGNDRNGRRYGQIRVKMLKVIPMRARIFIAATALFWGLGVLL